MNEPLQKPSLKTAIRHLSRGWRSAASSVTLCLLLAVSGCRAESGREANADPDAASTGLDAAVGAADGSDTAAVYDPALAAELGADDYGMSSYVMAFLRSGPNRDVDSATAAELQRAHLDNIIRMADDGDLLVAGPFGDAGDLRGIYIFDVETVEEARALTETDPAIRAGLFEMELHPWYGPAAMRALYDISQRVQKEGI